MYENLYLAAISRERAGFAPGRKRSPGSAAAEYFRKQMSREAAACAQGALDAGAEEVFVRDAHSSAKNIDPSMLPAHEAAARLAGRSLLHDERTGPDV